MKTERRQELRSNDLARMLEEAGEFLRKWSSYLVGGAAVVVVVIAFAAYRAKAAEQQLRDAWAGLGEIQRSSFFTQSREKRTDAEIKRGFERLGELADGAMSDDLMFEALTSQAQIAMELSTMGGTGSDPVYLDRAEQAYNALRDRLPENPLAVATALNGMVSVEADRFVVDGDPTCKERARKVLEQLRDDPRFANTPFQTSALARLNRLDEVFRRVELAPAPQPMPLMPVEGPPAPSTTTQAPLTPGGPRAERVPAKKPVDVHAEPGMSREIDPAYLESLAKPGSDEKGND